MYKLSKLLGFYYQLIQSQTKTYKYIIKTLAFITPATTSIQLADKPEASVEVIDGFHQK
jgi:hypothetical protein